MTGECKATSRNRDENGQNANHQSNYGTSLVSGIHGRLIASLAVHPNSVVLEKIQWEWLRFENMV